MHFIVVDVNLDVIFKNNHTMKPIFTFTIFCSLIFLFSSCSEEPSPTGMVIKEVTLISWPDFKPDSSPWDALDNPDLQFSLIQNNSALVTTSVGNEVALGTSLTLDNLSLRPSAFQPVTIQLIEYDIISANDMVGTVSFTPSDYFDEEQTYITMSNYDLEFAITVEYIY